MCAHNHRVLALGLVVCLVILIGEVASTQTPFNPAAAAADGLVRSELSLAGRTVTVAFAPALRADDPAHRGVVSGRSADARVRVAQLETNGALRLGALELGRDAPEGDAPAGLRYDLWLEGTTAGWQLQVTPVPGTGEPPAVAGQVVLSRHTVGVVSPTFEAALLPTAEEAGRLVLRWGEYEGAADMQVANPVRRPWSDAPPNAPVVRANDEDLSAFFRAWMLDQKNEAALVYPDGARVSVAFARRGVTVDDPDFARLASVADGAVVQLTEVPVPRLRNEVPLRFGAATVDSGNQVPGFNGAYGMWLKRVGGTWRLVFNHESDVWGSQHDPKFDAAEIELTHSQGQPVSPSFGVALVPTAADGGRLVVLWGPHQWSADFVVAGRAMSRSR